MSISFELIKSFWILSVLLPAGNPIIPSHPRHPVVHGAIKYSHAGPWPVSIGDMSQDRPLQFAFSPAWLVQKGWSGRRQQLNDWRFPYCRHAPLLPGLFQNHHHPNPTCCKLKWETQLTFALPYRDYYDLRQQSLSLYPPGADQVWEDFSARLKSGEL